MSDIAIKVENLSKLYQLGQMGTGTLSRDLNRWWASIRGKEDPYAKIGQVNDRTKKMESDFVWALKDVSFEVKQGEVLGIIGSNGAGKSTLLKILSKTTTPTSGKIYTKGRIASLLEVGTGFHPEMTGRENIFLNGAILGMSKSEIRKKFDEIVDFSGVEAYIDTPVKRYSSGMYVRLAFAVAAHLDCEIMIVDEVLAVGDADFQKKCLGKMREVSNREGRTVLFVSHNLMAIKNLCNYGVIIKNGNVSYFDQVNKVINKYLIEINEEIQFATRQGIITKQPEILTEDGIFKKIWIKNENNEETLKLHFLDYLYIETEFEAYKDLENIIFHFTLEDTIGNQILMACKGDFYDTVDIKKGMNIIKLKILEQLIPGSYIISLGVSSVRSSRTLYYNRGVISFDVSEVVDKMDLVYPFEIKVGYIKPKTEFYIN